MRPREETYKGYSSRSALGAANYLTTVAGGGLALPQGYNARWVDGVDIIGESSITLTTGSFADLMNASWAFPDAAVMHTLDTLEGGTMFFDAGGVPIVRFGYDWSEILNRAYVFIGTQGMVGYGTDQIANKSRIIRYLNTTVTSKFWKFATDSLRRQALLQISMLGDSITYGGYNELWASRIWTPQAVAATISAMPRTVNSGSELFQSKPHSLVGATEVAGVFTLTASVGTPNPRFYISTANPADLPSVADGEIYALRAEIDTTDCVGRSLAFSLYMRKADGTSIASLDGVSEDESTAGYRAVCSVLSVDYFKYLYPLLGKINVGASLSNTGTTGVGLIKNVTLHKLSSGIAVVNQGVTGDTAANGITRIATVTGWTPDVVIIAFGTNDVRNGVTLSTFLANLTTISNAVVTAGGYPVLASIPILAADQTNYALVPTWNTAIEELSDTLNVGFWDRYSPLTLADIEDGRHPNRGGYLKLAETLRLRII